MLRFPYKTCLLLICFVLILNQAHAQKVIHAVAGTLTSIDSSTKAMTVDNNVGTGGVFRISTGGKVDMEFDKSLRETAIPAPAFNKKGDSVIAYYYEVGYDSRTAVAIEDLGTAPLQNTTGIVTDFNRHAHRLVIQPASAGSASFLIDDKTALETSMGVEDDHQFSPQKGDRVRVVSTQGSGPLTAVLVIDK